MPGSTGPERLTTRILRGYLAWLHEQGYASADRRPAAGGGSLVVAISVPPGRAVQKPRRRPSRPAAGKAAAALPGGRRGWQARRRRPAATPLGTRDRAILETLYSAGLRVSELVGLNIDDLDLDGGVLTVRGKGKKERLALLGGPAIEAVRAWLAERAAARGRRPASRRRHCS